MRYYCKCGIYFSRKWLLREHIGKCNPYWPRTSEDDHEEVNETEWLAIQAELYQRLQWRLKC